MMKEFDFLDIKAESTELSDPEKQRLKEISLEMQMLWLKEETKARQRLGIGILWKGVGTLPISMR
jgi:hypothetical protein